MICIAQIINDFDLLDRIKYVRYKRKSVIDIKGESIKHFRDHIFGSKESSISICIYLLYIVDTLRIDDQSSMLRSSIYTAVSYTHLTLPTTPYV